MSKPTQHSIKDYLDLTQSHQSFTQLRERYPEYWQSLKTELSSATQNPDKKFLEKSIQLFKFHQAKIQKSGNDPKVLNLSLPHLIRARMLILALEEMNIAMQSGTKDGQIKLGFFAGIILQKLLFKQDLEPKQASLFWTKFWWRMLPSRRMLMPLLQKQGIWNLYSREMIRELAQIIGPRQVLEIGAGNGVLSSFLTQAGIDVIATDDQSWGQYIKYPPHVQKIDAIKALNLYKCPAVLCAWAPPNNLFESKIFVSTSVEIYISIGSRHHGACFNLQAYEEQQGFDWAQNETLAAQILPPTGDWVVHIFKRKKTRAS